MEKITKIDANSVCRKAGELVAGPRAVTHGDMELTHTRISDLWSAYLRGCEDPFALGAVDVLNMMELMKIGRRLGGEHNVDDYIDAAGYAALAGELSERMDEG